MSDSEDIFRYSDSPPYPDEDHQCQEATAFIDDLDLDVTELDYRFPAPPRVAADNNFNYYRSYEERDNGHVIEYDTFSNYLPLIKFSKGTLKTWSRN
jgi:hypothetical protein